MENKFNTQTQYALCACFRRSAFIVSFGFVLGGLYVLNEVMSRREHGHFQFARRAINHTRCTGYQRLDVARKTPDFLCLSFCPPTDTIGVPAGGKLRPRRYRALR